MVENKVLLVGAKVRAAKSHISCLRININGHLVEDSSVISVSFYIENACLTAILTVDEIKSTVFNMDPHSALGLDGFPGLFFKSFRDIVGQDIAGCVRQFFVDSWLPPELIRI
ncbi:hypothetical protein Patl1_22079 [Pistacia atlantica]|uniref:Uncharacterized protein n=1 Tax=Pistacia atlantica TaxID=434234 RepID=A0ACC1BMF8_9ROSI|nr:hypothetical protein Patl1_22079 [Pistacia atlantica]